MPKYLLTLLLAAALLAASSLSRPMPAYAMPAEVDGVTILVTSSLADAPDAAPGNGVCETASGNGICTLRAAVMEANALPGADTIQLPAGTYTLTRPGYEDAALDGDLDITGDLTLIGADINTTIINGNGGVTLSRVLQVHPGVTARLAGVCIQNGYGADDSGDDYGAGIHNAGSLTLENVCVRYNHAVFAGGGLYNTDAGDLTVLNSFITDNSTNNYGGGIVSFGNLTVMGSAISQNDAELSGGAIYNLEGTARITTSRFSANTAAQGGAVFLGLQAAAVVETSIFYGNTALEDGGAFQIYQSSLSLTNVTLSGNFARRYGGGLILLPDPQTMADLFNVTISNNRADSDNNATGDGGGIYRANAAGPLRMRNTILANNALERGFSDLANDCFGEIESQGYNLIRTTAGCNLTGVTTGNKTGMDPLLGPIGGNGGPTFTLALLPGSPAIDAGNPAGCGDALGAALLFDQRGYFRHTGARCDIGAFEYQSIQPFAGYLPLALR